MNATLEFDLDAKMYRAYTVFPSRLAENNQGKLGWTDIETVNGYGTTIDEAVHSLRMRLENREDGL